MFKMLLLLFSFFVGYLFSTMFSIREQEKDYQKGRSDAIEEMYYRQGFTDGYYGLITNDNIIYNNGWKEGYKERNLK